MRTDWRERDFHSDLDRFRSRSGHFAAALPLLDALRPLSSEQAPARHEQIGQRAGHEQAIGVLRDAAVAHLVESEDALQNPNRSEEHTSELQSHHDLVCRLLLEKKKKQ